VRPALASLLLFVGCAQERAHPRLAEITTPLHVTVRVVDAKSSTPTDVCEASVSVLDKAKNCWFAPKPHVGCVYVAVGTTADTPTAYQGAPQATQCEDQRARPGTIIVSREPRSKATLSVDPGGGRVVVDVGDEAWVLFVRGNELLTEESLWAVSDPPTTRPKNPDGTIDWSKVPTVLGSVDRLNFRLTQQELKALIAADPDGQQRLADALSRGTRLIIDEESFDAAFALLDEPHQQQVSDALLSSLRDGDVLTLEWFRHHPEREKELGEALLYALAENGASDPTSLTELMRLDPPGLEEAACNALERSWFEQEFNGYGYMSVDAELGPLAVLAKKKSKCPWLLPWLERSACSPALRCAVNRDVPEKEVVGEGPNPFAELTADAQKGLCTDAEQRAALERVFKVVDDENLDEEADAMMDPPEDWGALLLIAAKNVGPVPAEVIARNARRQYKLVFRPTNNEDLDDGCSYLEHPVDDWACRLPLAITRSTQGLCRLEIDDAKKTLTVIPQAEPANVPVRPEEGGRYPY